MQKHKLKMLAFLVFMSSPVFAFSQYYGQQKNTPSVYDEIPVGYRVFSLPLEEYQTKGLREKHYIDLYATLNKKKKISALLTEIKTAQRSENPGAIPLVFKTDADDEYVTVLLLQNVKVLYTPSDISDYKLDRPETGIQAKIDVKYQMDMFIPKTEVKEKTTLLGTNRIIRLLLTPEEAQLAAYALATDMKFSLVIRNGDDTIKKSVASSNHRYTFEREKQIRSIMTFKDHIIRWNNGKLSEAVVGFAKCLKVNPIIVSNWISG